MWNHDQLDEPRDEHHETSVLQDSLRDWIRENVSYQEDGHYLSGSWHKKDQILHELGYDDQDIKELRCKHQDIQREQRMAAGHSVSEYESDFVLDEELLRAFGADEDAND